MAGYWSAFTGRSTLRCVCRGGDAEAQRLTDGGMARGLAGLLGRRNRWMLCEERGRTWCDGVAGGEVTLTGDACRERDVTDVSLSEAGDLGSSHTELPREHVRTLQCWY
jgi:hypothetical protein